jgi:hypothetical protein
MVKHISGTRWPDDREVRWRFVRSVLLTKRQGAWVSQFSLETKADGLSVVWPQNHWDGFFGLGLKTGSYSLSVVRSQNHWDEFFGLCLKISSYGLWFRPQNHHDDFLVLASKPSGLRFVDSTIKLMGWWRREHGLRSSGLLCLKASWDRVSQSCLKTGAGAAWMVHVTYRGGCIELKLKMDELMRRVASDPSNLTLSFSIY